MHGANGRPPPGTAGLHGESPTMTTTTLSKVTCEVDAATAQRMRKATLLTKASICDALAKRIKRPLKGFEVAHHRAHGVLPAGIDDPTTAAAYWRGRAEEI